MIKKIDIEKIGLFSNYEWNKNIGGDNNSSFKNINIIYGRNYSGKTTLSRIFKSVENKELHKDYLDAKFVFTFDDETTISQNDLLTNDGKIKIRVYNTDFVKENLGWLHNEEGEIKPFTILGSINIQLETEINEITEKLGNEEAETGKLFTLFQKKQEFVNEDTKFKNKEKDLEQKLRNKARDIKNNGKLYNLSTYNISSIKKDLLKASVDKIINDDEIINKKQFLKEEPKFEIEKVKVAKPNFEKYLSETIELLAEKIQPSKPIADLVNDTLLQSWVEQGIDKHKKKRTTCGFCGSPLPKDLWDKLDAHFDTASRELKNKIIKQIDYLKQAQKGLNQYIKLQESFFYSNLKSEFITIHKQWENQKEVYKNNIEGLIQNLENRENDIFNADIFKNNEIIDNSDEIQTSLINFNSLIKLNNEKTHSLSGDQAKIRQELKISEIATFLENIKYSERLIEIEEQRGIANNLKIQKDTIENEIKVLIEQKRKLETQAKDESRGAELINEHLSSFFGHNELKLVAVEESQNTKFKITREGKEAKNLSEGECSLISFCYFIAKIEDEMQEETTNKKLIIYIDDPISSLDSNHIFYMFSLIENIIAKPKKYGQLFISTHNLDFLKYLKRLTGANNKEIINFFLIERRKKQNENRIFIILMPSYIRDYVTEFNYLFKEIYNLTISTRGDRKLKTENSFNQFYNIPNIMRKFLEYYLFYKYPNNETPLNNLDKLFEGNVPTLINRVINEYSHLTHIDRGWQPIDIAEAEKCAEIIIDKIKEKDYAQYEALVESIK